MRVIHISGATAGWPFEPMEEPVAAMSPGLHLHVAAEVVA